MATTKGLSKSATKKPSKALEKKAKKASAAARKSADKTKVRETRLTKRATQKSTKPTTGKSRWKEKAPGHAPQSARISAPKGPIQPEASRTWFAPKTSDKKNDPRKWLLIDAAGRTVGRLASEIATLLRGKHKASFTPNNDVGDFVVVVNADKVKFSSTKETEKSYHWHSGYIGGLKTRSPQQLRATYPDRILRTAVKGMVPRTPLGRSQMKKLKIYAGDSHPHTSQNPIVWNLRNSSVAAE